MDTGHFSYLYSGPAHTKVAAERLELLANIAAKRYLEEGSDLTGSIKKLAEENDLNANQIERVCEMANIATHRILWNKTAQKEDVEFPLAKAAAIVQVIAKKPEGSPCEEESSPVPPCMTSDYSGPPRGLPDSGPGLMSMMGTDPAEVHHGLGAEPESKRIIIIMQKKAEEKRVLQGELVYKGMELESLEKAAFNAVKREVLTGGNIRDLYAAAAATGLQKVAAEYFPRFEEQLIAETYGETRSRLEKLAIGQAPEELISEELGNMSVSNGAHPVLVSLDTVRKKTGEIRNGITNLLRINDELDIYSQRLRELQ